MAILSDPPEWRVPGQKPPQNIIEVLGWEVASHPPAPWFNWFFHRVFESLLELESATLARVVNEAGVPSIMAGPESERPAASQETVGRIYIATDTKRMFRDRGNGWDLLNTPDAIGAETPGGAQQKADAAVAAHANRTDNPHQVTAAQVGAPTQAAFDAHVTDTNNPHNVQAPQVPYSSGVAGFSPADVKAALDALAGVRIVEMGTNSNGTYVRWENGLQVCFGGILNQSAGTVLALTLPAAFATVEYFFLATASSSGPDTRYLVVEKRSAGVRTTSGLNIEFFAVTGTQPSSHNRFIAIGVWK